tara:strand:+ start:42643 stop:42909 length:267 start_codon:yes stop_codon:yes gene_type:complete
LAIVPHGDFLRGVTDLNVVEHINKADRWWNERRGLFFKPAAGYGSKAAYRGDKITKRVWQDILRGDYIAQHLVAPGVRVSGKTESPTH